MGDTNALTYLRVRGTTAAYNRAAESMLLAEVNLLARALELPEQLPIRESDLTEVHIAPPGFSDLLGYFGTCSTRNYHYSASVGHKFSAAIRNEASDVVGRSYFEAARRRYSGSTNQMNTNSACQLARQWLATVGVDVQALDRDSKVVIHCVGEGSHPVPIFSIMWRQPRAPIGKTTPPDPEYDGVDTVAWVQLVEPERRLLELEIDRSCYIKRQPLSVLDRERLLARSDNELMRQMWFTTTQYKTAALSLFASEVERIRRGLRFSDESAISTTNVTRAVVETPFISDHLGRFAAVWTENYSYAAVGDNKLNWIERNFEFDQERWYLGYLGAKYPSQTSEAQLRAAYSLATQWLAAVSVDVKALERDFAAGVRQLAAGPKTLPLYRIRWTRGEGENEEIAATVEVLEPERSLKHLWVRKTEYIKRDPLVVPNRGELLKEPEAWAAGSK